MPVTHQGDRLAGQAGMGGVWEWTSSPLKKWEGFEPMSLYPGYTGESRPRSPFAVKAGLVLTAVADFFDEKHNIVLGGSWATHPRIAGRKSL